MAENKKSIIIYTSWKTWLDAMNNDQKGQWLTWVMDYTNDLDPDEPNDPVVKMGCLIAKDVLKRDLKKYEAKVERMRNINETKKAQTNNDIDTKSTRSRNDFVSDNDNVNDNVNVNVNVNDNVNVLSYDNVFLVGIFNHWNSKPSLIHHKKMTKAMEEAIQKALSTYKYEIILQSIDRYVTVLDSRYSFNYRWSIDKFMERGVSNFTDDGSIWNTYVEQCKKNPFIQPQPKQEVDPTPDYVQDFLNQLK